VDGQTASFDTVASSQTLQAVVDVLLRARSSVVMHFEPGIEILPPDNATRTGDSNKGLKIISTSARANTITVVTEGLAGAGYTLRLAHPERVESVSGAERVQDGLRVTIPPGPHGEFLRNVVTIVTR
jgi:hypothetical protein